TVTCASLLCANYLFFFQAEDGIRDFHVTGVQTCALPILMRQMTTRDDFGQSDFFGIFINPNNDAQNDTEFFVFSSGTQADAIANPSIGEDFSWNAVWESKVNMVDDGWIVEVRIPYRALRFSNKNIQTWGLQFRRNFRRNSSEYSWNPIVSTKGYIDFYLDEIK